MIMCHKLYHKRYHLSLRGEGLEAAPNCLSCDRLFFQLISIIGLSFIRQAHLYHSIIGLSFILQAHLYHSIIGLSFILQAHRYHFIIRL